MTPYLISCVAYGQLYADLFLEHHLRSVLDETNLPALTGQYAIEYVLFTDKATEPQIAAHPNFKRLCSLVKVNLVHIIWPDGNEDRYNYRYGVLSTVYQLSAKRANETGSLLTFLCGDSVVAKDFFTKILARIEEGYDGVFMCPVRAAAEPMKPHLRAQPGALKSDDLWSLAYANLHPLWVSCHWDSPQFSKLPFMLFWNSGSGLLSHQFSVTPIVFRVTDEMTKAGAIIDIQVPGMIKNPYWAIDWDEAPNIGVEPLFCYFPTFFNRKASIEYVTDWAKTIGLDPAQYGFMRQPLYYPNRQTAAFRAEVAAEAQVIANEISRELITWRSQQGGKSVT